MKEIQSKFTENQVNDGQIMMIINESKRKAEELIKNIQVKQKNKHDLSWLNIVLASSTNMWWTH